MKRCRILIVAYICLWSMRLVFDVFAAEPQPQSHRVVSDNKKEEAFHALMLYNGHFFPAHEILNEMHEGLRQKVDTLFRRFVPRYICEVARFPDGEKVLVVFETQLTTNNLWAVNVFDKGSLKNAREHGAKRMVFESFYDVIDCGMTNCFGSPFADTLLIKAISSSREHNPARTNTLFFAFGRKYNEQEEAIRTVPLLVRVEDSKGVAQFDTWFTMRELVNESDLLPQGIPLDNTGIGKRLPVEESFIFREEIMKVLTSIGNSDSRVFTNAATPEMLARLIVLNIDTSKFRNDHELRLFQDAEETRADMAKLVKHSHPWIREYAEHYIARYTTSLGTDR